MSDDIPRYYTGAEARQLAGLLVRGGLRAVRGKSTDRIDGQIDRLRARAIERVQAEDDAVEDERRRKVRERAQQRAKRRA